MFSRFFIDRPIFATVLSIAITLAGAISLGSLPIAMYPPIAPPTVNVTCQYPGASAQVVAETIAAPIEQQVNGVENMMYMSSQCNNDGSYQLTITFKLGVDLDTAQVLVQNRVSQALPMLPDVIKATGVTVKKQSPSILLVVNLYSDVDPKRGGRTSTSCISATTRPSTSKTRWPAWTASATCWSSASRTTACASGSTRTSCRRAT